MPRMAARKQKENKPSWIRVQKITRFAAKPGILWPGLAKPGLAQFLKLSGRQGWQRAGQGLKGERLLPYRLTPVEGQTFLLSVDVGQAADPLPPCFSATGWARRGPFSAKCGGIDLLRDLQGYEGAAPPKTKP